MQTAPDLQGIGDIPADWTHIDKQVTPASPLSLPGAVFKWYDVHNPATPIAEAERVAAEEFVREQAGTGELTLEHELGFVILHLSGSATYFLIVCVWRSINEMWQALYAKDGAGNYHLVPDEAGFRPTQCVWELGPTAHERQAWSRYLSSGRAAADKAAYLEDRFTGLV